METMTLEQIAELTGKTPRTIRNWISTKAKLKPEVFSGLSAKISDAEKSKKRAEFTLDETLDIVRAGGNDTLAELLKENAKAKNNESKRIPGQDLEERIVKTMLTTLIELGIVKPASQLNLPKRLPLPGGNAMPQSDTLFPVPMTEREELNNLITEKAHDWNFPREEVFKRLYTEINYRKQTNIQHGARKNNCKTVLDYLERKEWIGFAIGVLKEL